MTSNEKQNRIKDLESLISRNISLYYKDSSKAILDIEFDLLVEELSELNPESPVLKLMEDNMDNYEKVTLPFRLYSQKKLKTIYDLNNWFNESKRLLGEEVNNLSLIITPKYDGICLSQYGNTFYTRGADGIEGFDVTKRVMEALSKITGYPFKGNGELICSNANFNLYFRNQGYTSPRNLIQAIFSNKLKSLPDHLDKIDYLRYYSNEEPVNMETMLRYCNEFNFDHTVPYAKVKVKDLNENFLDELFKLWNTNYNIDGLVIDFDDYRIRIKLGYQNKYPQFSRAYKPSKYNKELKFTTIKNIRYQISRYGKIAPVAEVEPVLINDGMVSNVSLYNARYLVQNKVSVGRSGYIFRSGSINPKFDSFVEYEDPIFNLIEECPYCNSILEWDEDKVDLYCVNDKCKEKRAQQIHFFFKTIGIKDFGLESIRSFIFEGDLFNLEDFFSKEKIYSISVKGIGQKTKDLFFENLNKIKEEKVKLEVIQEALGVFEGIAKQTLKILNTVNIDLEYLYNDSYYNEKRRELISLKEIGEPTADTYLLYLPKFWRRYKRISNFISIKEEENLSDDKFKDMIIVFTGFRDDSLKELIEKSNGKVTTSVSSLTNYVITKDKNSNSSKLKTARDKNIQILSIDEFKTLFSLV